MKPKPSPNPISNLNPDPKPNLTYIVVSNVRMVKFCDSTGL